MALREFTRHVGKIIGPLGGGYMLDFGATGVFGEQIGLDFFGFYALGRGGVLGDVDGKTVADAFYFFEPNLVSTVWEAAKAKVEPDRAVDQFTAACRAWGRTKLAGVAGFDDFNKLAERIVDEAPTEGLPLFEGWREIELPDDATERAYQLIHVLRDLRGGAHVNAVREAGLTPHEAVSLNSPHMVQLFGWPEVLPEAEAKRNRADLAEDRTDEIAAPAFSVLDEGEQELFAEVVEAAGKAAGV